MQASYDEVAHRLQVEREAVRATSIAERERWLGMWAAQLRASFCRHCFCSLLSSVYSALKMQFLSCFDSFTNRGSFHPKPALLIAHLFV